MEVEQVLKNTPLFSRQIRAIVSEHPDVTWALWFLVQRVARDAEVPDQF
jgi:hypothetical protein